MGGVAGLENEGSTLLGRVSAAVEGGASSELTGVLTDFMSPASICRASPLPDEVTVEGLDSVLLISPDNRSNGLTDVAGLEEDCVTDTPELT